VVRRRGVLARESDREKKPRKGKVFRKVRPIKIYRIGREIETPELARLLEGKNASAGVHWLTKNGKGDRSLGSEKALREVGGREDGWGGEEKPFLPAAVPERIPKREYRKKRGHHGGGGRGWKNVKWKDLICGVSGRNEINSGPLQGKRLRITKMGGGGSEQVLVEYWDKGEGCGLSGLEYDHLF